MRIKVCIAFIAALLVTGISRSSGGQRGGTASITGTLKSSRDLDLKDQCATPETAYWSFGVPGLSHPPCRPVYAKYIITLDHWNQEEARKALSGKDLTIKLEGVDFKPVLTVIPKEGQTYHVTIRNTDRFRHAIHSPENKNIDTEIIESGTAASMKFSSLPSLDRGEVLYYPLRCKYFDHMRGGVAFVHSTSYAVVGPQGRFSIQRVPPGKYRLKVWRKGEKIHEKSITVDRRGLRLDLNLLEKKKDTSEDSTEENGAEENGAEEETTKKTDKSADQRSRRRRRRRR